jgi:hypothetical protein
MTEEELVRFALVLREAERVRARIAEDEAAAHTDGGGNLLPVGAIQTGEQPSGSAIQAAA